MIAWQGFVAFMVSLMSSISILQHCTGCCGMTRPSEKIVSQQMEDVLCREFDSVLNGNLF